MPDTQIGYRDGNDIIFQESALVDHPEDKDKSDYYPPSYNVLHELLHGLVPGSKQFHQMKVGALNDFLKENRGHYTEEMISNALVAADINAYQYIRMPFGGSAFNLLLNEEGSFSARCWILYGEFFWGINHYQEVFNKLGYSSCVSIIQDRSVRDYFLEQHPEFKALDHKSISESYSSMRVYAMNLKGKVDRDVRDTVIDQCKQNASDDLKKHLEDTLLVYNDLIAMAAKAKSTEPSDPAEKLVHELIVSQKNSNLSPDFYRLKLEDVRGALKTWQANREQCTKAFPKLKWN